MRPLDEVFPALTTSAFRRRFRLAPRELEYLRIRGLDAVLAHATQFVDARLAAAQPANDGRQTPFRGHPAFVAQHATATCCRGCLQQWHAIPRGRPLTEPEKRHVVTAIGRWLDAALRQAQAREVGTDAAALDGASEPARRRAPSRLAPRKENSLSLIHI